MAKKINIKGPIIPSNHQYYYDWWEMEATSPKKVSDLLDKADGEDIEVEINSGGGSVTAASEIYTALKSYKGKVTVRIVGLAASAASVIAMAGDKVSMSPTGQIMIHNSTTWADGDYRDMEHAAEVLKTVNKTISNAYKIKTGKTQEELLALMDNETWMSAERAKELGFIDEIMFEDENLWVANFDDSGMLPPEVINKMRNELEEQKNKANKELELAKAKLALEIEASYFNYEEE